MKIRQETGADVEKIGEITKAAFANHPYSVQTEHLIVAALRNDNVLTVSLVAEVEGRLVGHVAFSPVAISDGSPDWYGLGPVSVVPDFQGRGIGTALVMQGLLRLRESGASGCVVVGEPGYYQRFGFRHSAEMTFEGVRAEYFMALPFSAVSARGNVTYHDAFMIG